MINYKPLLIAEIGLNYIGQKKILFDYINKTSKYDLDGITIQLLNKHFYKGKFKKYLLDDKTILKFIDEAKKKFKLVGIASDDMEIISKVKKKIDFVKILSKDFTNTELINHCIHEKINNIYISTGFEKSLIKIRKNLKKINSKRLNIIHTNLKKTNMEINLSYIEILRKNLKLQISYGNHSNFTETIANSIFFFPKTIFFYVKLNNYKQKFPDDKHAIKINEINNIISKFNQNIMTL